MKQKVRVLFVDGNDAKVIYKRPTACHGDCDHCAGGCGAMAATENIVVEAENLIGARPGDSVMIEGEGRKVASAILLVYVIPVVLFFLGYFFGQALDAAPSFLGILGFFLGLVLAVLVSRRQKLQGKAIRFRIVSYAHE